MTLSELFTELSRRGLTVRRNADDGLECIGNLDHLTDKIKTSLQEHRGEFLRLLPSPEKIAEERRVILDDFTEWLNLAMPDAYRLADHAAFWQEHDHQLTSAIDTGDILALKQVISELKDRTAIHFLPHHQMPKAGETLVVYPGHELLDFEWDERQTIQGVESLYQHTGIRDLAEAIRVWDAAGDN